MRKPEQKLYDKMRKNAPNTSWLQRIENIVAEGMPDVHVSGPESECWVELKAVNRPKRETTRLLGTEGLRPSQVNWHLKAGTKRMTTFILITDDEGNLWLVEGKHAASINEWTMYTFDHLDVPRTWDGIFKTIMGWSE